MYNAAGYYLYLPAYFYDDLGEINQAVNIIAQYNSFSCNFNDVNHKVGKKSA